MLVEEKRHVFFRRISALRRGPGPAPPLKRGPGRAHMGHMDPIWALLYAIWAQVN